MVARKTGAFREQTLVLALWEAQSADTSRCHKTAQDSEFEHCGIQVEASVQLQSTDQRSC